MSDSRVQCTEGAATRALRQTEREGRKSQKVLGTQRKEGVFLCRLEKEVAVGRCVVWIL